MIIATYNIWNDAKTLGERLPALIEEITRIDADVIAMQEVAAAVPGQPDAGLIRLLAERCGYPYFTYFPYPSDPEEGLAIMSRTRIAAESAIWFREGGSPHDCAIRSVIRCGGGQIAVTNVHLDWRSALVREKQIAGVIGWIDEQASEDVPELLCGDFNAAPDSSVHRFVTGRQSLAGLAACWVDAAEYESYRSGAAARPTLDFLRNPRWSGGNTLQIPARVDWILLRLDGFGPEPVLHRTEIFGTEPTRLARKVPSDHYGVKIEVDFPYL